MNELRMHTAAQYARGDQARRTYGVVDLLLAGLALLIRLPLFLRARLRGKLNRAFKEKLMLVVTAVHDCRYCAWFHARTALRSEVPDHEIAALLGGSIDRAVRDDEALGLAFAQHYAETDARPEAETLTRLRLTYGTAMAEEILLTLRWITFANRAGNGFHAFAERVRRRRLAGPNLLGALTVFLVTAPIFAPLGLLMWLDGRRSNAVTPRSDEPEQTRGDLPASWLRSLENRLPPPVVAALFALVAWGLSHATPRIPASQQALSLAAGVIAALGFTFLTAGVAAFGRARTTINPLQPERATSLVSHGIYRVSRNPMYVGDALLLVAFAVHLAAPGAFFGALGFVLYIDRFQITPEERVLCSLFGSDYEGYKARVRRWL